MSARSPHFDGQHWSNADEDRVEVVAADPGWAQRFAEEAEAIRRALQLPDLAIEHIGSTAVPGLDAKPIIDMLLLPAPGFDRFSLIEPLERLGYQYWRENPKPERMFFVKGMPPFGNGRSHHIHLIEPYEVQRRLAFRDWLRAQPDDARMYAKVKRELARRFPTDREAYTDGKGEVIAQILRRALNSP